MGREEKKEKEEEEEEKEEEKEKEEENETTDSTSTPESSRNPTVPCTSEVATEPTNAEFDPDLEVTEFDQVKTHPRPLQRARSRYKERTGNSPWENRHSSDCSPHVPAVESGKHPGEACLEPDEVQCKGCNSIMTLTQALKDLGWDAETLKQNPICAACINHWSF